MASTQPHSTRVLVCDDDRSSCYVVEGLLFPTKMTVDAVHTAAAALHALRRGYYDVLLMDLVLPDTDGFDLIPLVRALPGRAGRIPIIVISAKVMPADIERAFAAGANDFVTKPVSGSTLIDIIRSVIAAD
jgi:CheY-like chemotaxis protein